MTVLRSQEVLPPPPTPKSLKPPSNHSIRPSTPSQLHEIHSRHYSPLIPSHSPNPEPDSVAVPGVVRRRSSRLADKGLSGEHSAIACLPDNRLRKKDISGQSRSCSTELKADFESSGKMSSWHSGLASNEKFGVRLGDGVEDLEVNDGTEGLSETTRSIELRYPGSKSGKAKGKRKLIPDSDLPHWDFVHENPDGKECLSLRSGTRVLKKVKQGLNVDVCGHHSNGNVLVDEEKKNLSDNENNAIARDGIREVAMEKPVEECPRTDENVCVRSRKTFSSREKDKWNVDDLNSNANVAVTLHFEPNGEKLIDGIADDQGNRSAHERPMRVEDGTGDRNLDVNDCAVMDQSTYAENGEGKSIEPLLSPSDKVRVESNMRCEGSSIDSEVSGTPHLTDSGPLNNERMVMECSPEVDDYDTDEFRRQMFRQRFRNGARRSAHVFAHFPNNDAENSLSAEAEGEKEIDDWPGPFSTAMKIAKDRAAKDLRVTKSSSEKNKPAPVVWTPRKAKCPKRSKSPPFLRDLCLCILAKNSDAIASLDFVPDALRHRLSRILCDSRKMNKHFMNLLLRGSPTEVCVRDCSWLDEDEFVNSFQGCDTSKLTILQLDQCGRCIVDSVLISSLAWSPNSLPALQSLSLGGACRLSDLGITALVSSAPALQYIDLSQCSFLTSSSIDTLAESLGSTLRELYLNDCQNLVPMLMISALKKFEHLEVLSLAGIQYLCDNFIQEFVSARGHNMKEIILTDCVRLTDKSIKAISETCSALCAIDLVNLTKLSDYALCCLASGCQTLQKVKLSRNLFSDEAVAAFVEIAGESLNELSLNSVRKVSSSTATSLACFSRNLVSLDLSWCRNLTDAALGMIVDNCSALRVLKLFGCTQVTNVFLDGHSNAEVEIIGLKMSPLWENVESSNPHKG